MHPVLQTPRVSVQYHSMLNGPSDLAKRIAGLGPAQVITWFCGRKGVRADWLNFFKAELLEPLRSTQNLDRFLLWDLSAWEKLKGALPTQDKVIQALQDLCARDLEVLNGETYFEFLKKGGDNADYVREHVLTRPFIWENSEKTQSAFGRVVKEALPSSMLSSEVVEKDVAFAYSGLQYLEGLFLVQEALKRRAQSNTVVFLLPNDELKYYDDGQGSFQKDLEGFLGKAVNVHFIPFRFGEDLSCRPYLSNGPKVKPEEVRTLLTDPCSTALKRDYKPTSSLEPSCSIAAYSPQQQYAFGEMVRSLKTALMRSGFAFTLLPSVTEPLTTQEPLSCHTIIASCKENGLEWSLRSGKESITPTEKKSASLAACFRQELPPPGMPRVFMQLSLEIKNPEEEDVSTLTSLLKTMGVDDLEVIANDAENFKAAIDITHLFETIKKHPSLYPNRCSVAEVLVCYAEPALQLLACKVAQAFRKQGIPTEIYSGSSQNIRKQIEHGKSKGILTLAMVRGTENIVIERQGTQTDLSSLESLNSYILGSHHAKV